MFGLTSRRPAAAPTPLSVLAAGLELTGSLRADGAVRIDGRVTGLVQVAGCVIIGTTGEVDGDVQAVSAVVAGCVRGDLVASDVVTLSASAVVDGDIHAPRLGVESGAAVNGRIVVGDVARRPPTPLVLAGAGEAPRTLVAVA